MFDLSVFDDLSQKQKYESLLSMMDSLLKDVHSFPGHIACDSQSNSEIVIPLKQNNRVYGVLDLDSPTAGRFDEQDKIYLEKAVEIINKYVNWGEIN